MIRIDDYIRRRRQLMKMTGPGSIIIQPGAPVARRNNDVDYPYRQDSDLYYLSGFGEPEAVMVLVPGREHGEHLMFCRERDREREIWDGHRAGQEGVINDFGFDDAFPIADLDDILPGLIENKEKVFFTLGRYPQFDERLIGWVNRIRALVKTGARPPDEVVSLEHLVHDMRLFKTRTEVSTMRKSAQIAAKAHIEAMQRTRPGLGEQHIHAALLNTFFEHGTEPSYQPIVAGGANACILHYIENNKPLNDGDLLLVDAGCEYDCYASDITRTWPVNGRFTGEQKAVYEVVLEAQEQAIATLHPGRNWLDAHNAALNTISQGLVDLGLVKATVEQCIEQELYQPFFMHKTGHWIGLDVHDVGDYKVDSLWRELEPGMVTTVEPGIYIAPDNEQVDAKWRGIGVRIEDDVVVTRKGPDILSKNAPKTVNEIEQLLAG